MALPGGRFPDFQQPQSYQDPLRLRDSIFGSLRRSKLTKTIGPSDMFRNDRSFILKQPGCLLGLRCQILRLWSYLCSLSYRRGGEPANSRAAHHKWFFDTGFFAQSNTALGSSSCLGGPGGAHSPVCKENVCCIDNVCI